MGGGRSSTDFVDVRMVIGLGERHLAVGMIDADGNEHLVHTFNPRPVDLKGRLINIYIDRTEFKVAAMKLVLDCSKVPGYNGIDAIAVS